MTEIDLIGLDGANPLHALASFGALLLSDDRAPGEARMGWVAQGGGYHPRLQVPGGSDEWVEAIAAALQGAGREASPPDEVRARKRDLGELRATLKKRAEPLKKARARLRRTKPDARPALEEEIAAMERELHLGREAVASAYRDLSAALGWGPAHLGDIIGVPADIYRLHAARALEEGAAPWLARQLAALGSDGCLEKSGEVVPTPISFSNGSSNQLLLHDFRVLARGCGPEDVRASLLEGQPRLREQTSLNWSPSDLRPYAHRFRDPGQDKAGVDAVANALAFVGLGLLPVAPRPSGPEAVGFPGRAGLVWPIWQPRIGPRVAGSLLVEASAWLRAPDPRLLEARGVLAVYFSRRVNPTGKRNYLAPARPL